MINQDVTKPPAPAENVLSIPSQKSSPLVTRIIDAVTTAVHTISTPFTIIKTITAIAIIRPIPDSICIPSYIVYFIFSLL